jgi:hypothetical protein
MVRKVGTTMRIQLDMPEEKVQEIERIMAESGVKTKKEFFNLAMSLLKWAIQEKKDGKIIASVDEKEDKYKELMLPV